MVHDYPLTLSDESVLLVIHLEHPLDRDERDPSQQGPPQLRRYFIIKSCSQKAGHGGKEEGAAEGARHGDGISHWGEGGLDGLTFGYNGKRR